MPAKYQPPEGWTLQAFQFALDPTPEQWQVIRRQWGGRRYAFNWTLRTIEADIEAWRATGESSEAPSLYGLRKRWNEAKGGECVDEETGELWWPEVSKEAFADGVRGAVDAYWRWQRSRAGELAGRRVGFPRFKRKGRDEDRATFSTGALRLESDRRHVMLPKVGTVRTSENTRRLERLLAKGRARILAATLKRVAERAVVTFRVEIARPQQGHPDPASTVGIDVGSGCWPRSPLPTRSSSGSPTRARWPRTSPLCAASLGLSPAPSAARTGSAGRRHGASGCRRTSPPSGGTRSTGSPGDWPRPTAEIVVEGLDAAGMMRQKGLPGARARRRGLADAALAEPRRQLRHKAGWYGSEVVEADRFFPSSKTCHNCGHVQDIGWAECWTCDGCGVRHQRDDNAAINLARYRSPVGPVGASVKRGANRKTRRSGRVAENREVRKDNSERSAA